MKEIKTVSIIGLGALGTMYAERFSKNLPSGSVRVIVDSARRERYERDGVFANGERLELRFIEPRDSTEPADLVLVSTKYHHLGKAIEDMASQVGEHTIIISALNGIVSEERLAERFGWERVIYCIAQGSDAVREGNSLTYKNIGLLCVGEREGNYLRTKAVADFLERAGMPHEAPDNIIKRLWSKWMMNCGVNQVTAVKKATYGAVQLPGAMRDDMVASMSEVMRISEKAGINLTGEDIDYWLKVISGLSPSGKTSMCQDVEARRKTEVELFAGTVIELSEKYNIEPPVNRRLYNELITLEREFGVR